MARTLGDDRPWRAATDDALVERLIGAMQRATVAALPGEDRDGAVGLPAPEMAAALLNLLASVLEAAPQCRTPAGMRQVSEAAGKELHVLLRGYRGQAGVPSGVAAG